MNRTLRTSLTAAAILTTSALLAHPAHAQMQWTDKGFASVSFGVQAPSHALETNTTFDIYGETASQIASQEVGGGAFFDISGGYKVWRNLAAGIGITFVGSTSDLIVNAEIPDPDFFDRPRAVSTTLTDAKHSQTAINLTGTWMMPVTDKIDVGFQFGPTIFLMSQDVPGTLQVAEPGPTVTSAALTKDDHTTVGIHFGIDATYLVTPRFGAGVLVRYSVGSVDVVGSSDGLTLGGFQIGFGGRVRF
jgi:Outer membrane protein beta-barrel domain